MGDLHLLNITLAGLGIMTAGAVVLALAIIGIAALVLRSKETVSAAPALVGGGDGHAGRDELTASPNRVRRAA